MLTKLSQAITITACLYLIMNLSQLATVQPSAHTTLTREPPTNAANQVKSVPQLVKFDRSKP